MEKKKKKYFKVILFSSGILEVQEKSTNFRLEKLD